MQFLYRLKFGCALVMFALVSVVVHAADGDHTPIQTPLNSRAVYDTREGAVVVPTRSDHATIAGTTTCELLGDPNDNAFQGSSRYRGNVISIEEETIVVSFEMELTIIQPTTLQFTVHERQENNTYLLIASRTRNEVVGDAFHPSGPLPGEVILQAGKTYAFGVTWNTNLIYYIGDSGLLTNFPTGEILGWVGRNSIQPPVDDLPSMGTNDSGNYSMRICLPPAPGACCRPNATNTSGECVDVFEEECFEPGSTFHGQRTRCSETLCEQGACCLPCGGSDCLENYTPQACLEAGGETATHWAGLDCSNIDLCKPVTGACCVSETCTVLCEEDCLDPFVGGGAGTYHGDGTDCEQNVCIGACCKDETCENNTATACRDLIFGVFHGEGTTCETLDPSVGCGNGACCFTNAEGKPDCELVASRSECSEELQGRIDAVYKGDGTVCEYVLKCFGGDNPGILCGDNSDCLSIDPDVIPHGSCLPDFEDVICPDPASIGGCCLPNGTCVDTTQTFCETNWVGGIYNAVNACDSLTCTGGSCCLDDGSCQVLTQEGCTLFAGTFTGNATCDSGTCSGVSSLFGACCGTDIGICDLRTQFDCELRSDTFLGVGSDCVDPNTCPGNGACCKTNGDCFDDVSSARCVNAIQAIYLDDGSSCTVDAGSCDERGACCTPRGECRFLLAEECTFLQGIFDATEVCAPDFCVSGACCLGGGDCEVRIIESCLGFGETYQGDDTNCGSGACDVGSCCGANGVCVDGLLTSECTGINDDYNQDLTCDEVDELGLCTPVGACCLGSFTCENLRQPECEDADGVYQGDHTRCDVGDEICTPGACCLSDQSCQDQAYAASCTTDGGEYHETTICVDRPCDATGACCLNSSCTTQNQIDCEQNGGTYLGDGAECDPGVCTLGACCQLNGTCDDGVLPSTCTGIDDVFRSDRTCSQFCIARGACCLDEDCSVTTELLCSNAGGIYGLAGSVCRDRDNLCEVGACCMPLGVNACNEFTEMECLLSDGIYQGPFSNCDHTTNANGCVRGGCCNIDGTCDDLTVISECLPPSVFFTDRQRCTEIDCEPRGACCFEDTESCDLLTNLDCLGLGGLYNGDATECTPDLCVRCRPVLFKTVPPNCATDPAYPHDPLDVNIRFGWDEIVIEFDCDPPSVSPTDFAINGPDAPFVSSVVATGAPNTYRLTLSSPIATGGWTEILHIPGGSFMNLASLPGDADGTGTSNIEDIMMLIDHINGKTAFLVDWKCDIDRSGECGPPDILALINLLNGAEMFDVWMNDLVPSCPTGR